jgi:anti-sigma factor RsiW
VRDDAIDCRDLVELVTDYLESTLIAGDVARIEAHLPLCRACEAYIAQMRLTRDSIARLDVAVLPSEHRAALLTAFRKWKADCGEL